MRCPHKYLPMVWSQRPWAPALIYAALWTSHSTWHTYSKLSQMLVNVPHTKISSMEYYWSTSSPYSTPQVAFVTIAWKAFSKNIKCQIMEFFFLSLWCRIYIRRDNGLVLQSRLVRNGHPSRLKKALVFVARFGQGESCGFWEVKLSRPILSHDSLTSNRLKPQQGL